MTWCKNKDPDVFWPVSFLPLEPGLGDARIMTFGYNSHFQPGLAKNRMVIQDFSKELLYDMKYGLDNTVDEAKTLELGDVSSAALHAYGLRSN
jgi:hypothetical protein